MSSLPTPEDAARRILDIFVKYNTRPQEGLRVPVLAGAFSGGLFRNANLAEGLEYAGENGWTEYNNRSGFCRLTESGFDEAHRKPALPANASQGHTNKTVIHVGEVHNSPFQFIAAGASGVQNTHYQVSGADLRSIIELYRENVDGLNLRPEERKKADKAIRAIEHQIEDDDPDQTIVRQAGTSLKTIVEGAIGGAIGNAVANPGIWAPLFALFS